MFSNLALKKLTADLRDALTGDYAEQFHIEPIISKVINPDGTITDEHDMFHWTGVLNGPSDTPYSGGKFKLDIVIPDTYPNKPPVIKFTNKIFHPNIDKHGQVCLNILRSPPNGDWKPSINLPKTILSIHSLLSDPNPKDALNSEAGSLYLDYRELFDDTAREWTRKYA